MKRNRSLQCIYIFVTAVVIFSSCKIPAAITINKSSTWYFSPIPAIGLGPNGLPSKKINVNPHCCSDGIQITAATQVAEGDLQWVSIPLSLPADSIKSVKVCYSTSNGAYISQTRLSNMTTPDFSTVRLDDPTDQTSAAANCYMTATNVKVDGTITFSLKVVIPKNGSVTIGSIAIGLK